MADTTTAVKGDAKKEAARRSLGFAGSSSAALGIRRVKLDKWVPPKPELVRCTRREMRGAESAGLRVARQRGR